MEKLENGYRGSIRSRRWKNVFYDELKRNPSLFSYEIISQHSSRQKALYAEYKLQKELGVVSSDDYFNEAYANVNGYCGRNVKGKNNPMYGRKKEVIALDTVTGNKVRVSQEMFNASPNLIGHSSGFLSVFKINSSLKKPIMITREEYAKNKSLYRHANIGKRPTQKTINKLKAQREDTTTVTDWEGNFYRVNKNDPRCITGELVNAFSKRWIVTSPDGKQYKTMVIKKFCKDNGLELIYIPAKAGEKSSRRILRDIASKVIWEIEEIKTKETKDEI